MAFELHPRLAADTHFIADLPLCRVLLMNDRRFPWAILVPRVVNAREIHALSLDRQQQLLTETVHFSRHMEDEFNADKMNIGALGNMVPQLHIHIIARRETDPAWPAPVWGNGKALSYDENRDPTISIFRKIASSLDKTA